jgi:hypothetical protein
MAGKGMLAALVSCYQEVPLLYPLTRNIQGSKRPPQFLSRHTLSYQAPSHDSQWQVHMKVGKHGTIAASCPCWMCERQQMSQQADTWLCENREACFQYPHFLELKDMPQ